MTNEQIETGMRKGWGGGKKTVAIVKRGYRIARVAVLVLVVLFAGLGVYVMSQGELRNEVIDHAQGQNEVVASPKE